LSYDWKDIEENSETAKDYFVLPVNPSAPPSITRSQEEVRMPLDYNEPPMTNNNYHLLKRIGEKTYRKCNFWNCTNTSRIAGTSFQCIPKRPKISNLSYNNRECERMRFFIQNSFRTECYFRCGLDINIDKRKDVRICNGHGIEEVIKNVRWVDTNDNKRIVSVKMYLPVINMNPTSTNSQRSNRCGGLGQDRWIQRQLDCVIQLSQELNLPISNQLQRVGNEIIFNNVTPNNDDTNNNINNNITNINNKNKVRCDYVRTGTPIPPNDNDNNNNDTEKKIKKKKN
jgi:hypothetical protein